MSADRYFQCLIRRGTAHQTAWIPERGAKIGYQIELLPSHEMWSVVEVYDFGLPEPLLREQQRLNRHSLPSVDPIR